MKIKGERMKKTAHAAAAWGAVSRMRRVRRNAIHLTTQGNSRSTSHDPGWRPECLPLELILLSHFSCRWTRLYNEPLILSLLLLASISLSHEPAASVPQPDLVMHRPAWSAAASSAVLPTLIRGDYKAGAGAAIGAAAPVFLAGMITSPPSPFPPRNLSSSGFNRSAYTA